MCSGGSIVAGLADFGIIFETRTTTEAKVSVYYWCWEADVGWSCGDGALMGWADHLLRVWWSSFAWRLLWTSTSSGLVLARDCSFVLYFELGQLSVWCPCDRARCLVGSPRLDLRSDSGKQQLDVHFGEVPEDITFSSDVGLSQEVSRPCNWTRTRVLVILPSLGARTA